MPAHTHTHTHTHTHEFSGQLSEAVQVLSEYTGPLTPRPHALKQLLNELIKQGRPQEEVGVVTEVLRSLPYLTPAGVTDILLWVYLENGRMDEAREVVKVSGRG